MYPSDVEKIVVHCSATRQGQRVTAEAINRMHQARGMRRIGYHNVVLLDGTIEAGREIGYNQVEIGAHARGHNHNSIGVCLVGGLGPDGKPFEGIEHYEPAQVQALRDLLHVHLRQFPKAEVLGHRDLSPDRDGDGVVEPHEWLKNCPCFDVREWWAKETRQ